MPLTSCSGQEDFLTVEHDITGPSAYAVLPFEPYGGRLVEENVRLACGAAGVRFELADRRLFEAGADDRLLADAQHRIDRANIIISDVTSDPAALLYLTGYAYTRKKKVVLVAFDTYHLPHDFRDRRRVISYGGMLGDFRESLVERVRRIITPPVRAQRLKRSHEARDSAKMLLELPEPDRVFISYSHRDAVWLDRLKIMSAPLVWSRKLEIWDDEKIRPGERWRASIESAVWRSRVAVLLVSANFLASEFITQHELPLLLGVATEQRLAILWMLLSACLYEETVLSEYQAAHDTSKPLDSLTVSKRNEVLRDICRRISEAWRPAG